MTDQDLVREIGGERYANEDEDSYEAEILSDYDEWEGGEIPDAIPEEVYELFTDRFGRAFDAEIHRTGDTGLPKLSDKRYNLLSRPGCLPDSERSSSGGDSSSSDDDGDSADKGEGETDKSPQRQRMESTAHTMVSLFEAGNRCTLGLLFEDMDHFTIGEKERERMMGSVIEYQKHRDIIDLPPEIGLLVSVVEYYQIRLDYSDILYILDYFSGDQQPEDPVQEESEQSRPGIQPDGTEVNDASIEDI